MGGGGGDSYYSPSHRSIEDSEKIFRSAVDENKETKTRNVFISFQIEDEAQINLFRHQARTGRGIEFRDYSVKQPFDEKWKTNCRERIAMTSALIVFIGPTTAQSAPVDWEIKEAYRQNKKVIGVKIHRDKNYPIPEALRQNNARIVTWDNQTISDFLAED